MGLQSARMWFQGADHKEIWFQGHYHDAMYKGATLVWKKLKSIFRNKSIYTTSINGTADVNTSAGFLEYQFDDNAEPNQYSPYQRIGRGFQYVPHGYIVGQAATGGILYTSTGRSYDISRNNWSASPIYYKSLLIGVNIYPLQISSGLHTSDTIRISTYDYTKANTTNFVTVDDYIDSTLPELYYVASKYQIAADRYLVNCIASFLLYSNDYNTLIDSSGEAYQLNVGRHIYLISSSKNKIRLSHNFVYTGRGDEINQLGFVNCHLIFVRSNFFDTTLHSYLIDYEYRYDYETGEWIIRKTYDSNAMSEAFNRSGGSRKSTLDNQSREIKVHIYGIDENGNMHVSDNTVYLPIGNTNFHLVFRYNSINNRYYGIYSYGRPDWLNPDYIAHDRRLGFIVLDSSFNVLNHDVRELPETISTTIDGERFTYTFDTFTSPSAFLPLVGFAKEGKSLARDISGNDEMIYGWKLRGKYIRGNKGTLLYIEPILDKMLNLSKTEFLWGPR